MLPVKLGSELTFGLRDGYNNLMTPSYKPADLPGLDTSQAGPAFGPVAVEGAELGHVIRQDILELNPAADWTAILHNSGLMRDEFPLLSYAGALFSCGNGHAAQSGGEMCSKATETPKGARLRLTPEKSKPGSSRHII
ncbi:hypothetical protein E4U55_004282 [Claviceps digitariae]|nr:hypothetical protein E4U55_004282 [Claviceps digitariae]